ncbi:hypothetical protein QYF36_000106 [Acer negundo]|nr:hypothetical protein QYF36_000106 [Acer negundo]
MFGSLILHGRGLVPTLVLGGLHPTTGFRFLGSGATAPGEIIAGPNLLKTALTGPNLSKTCALVLGPALLGRDPSSSYHNPYRKLETCWSKKSCQGGPSKGRSLVGFVGLNAGSYACSGLS